MRELKDYLKEKQKTHPAAFPDPAKSYSKIAVYFVAVVARKVRASQGFVDLYHSPLKPL